MINQSLQYKHQNPILRFIDHIQKNGECWDWTSTRKDGYGTFWYKGKIRYAHRISYEFFRGDITDNLQIDHLCRNRSCVNPDHLEAVTQAVNVQRGSSPRLTAKRQTSKTHCPHGHPYDESNTYYCPKGFRKCIECRRTQQRVDYKKSRLKIPSVHR